MSWRQSPLVIASCNIFPWLWKRWKREKKKNDFLKCIDNFELFYDDDGWCWSACGNFIPIRTSKIETLKKKIIFLLLLVGLIVCCLFFFCCWISFLYSQIVYIWKCTVWEYPWHIMRVENICVTANKWKIDNCS